MVRCCQLQCTEDLGAKAMKDQLSAAISEAEQAQERARGAADNIDSVIMNVRMTVAMAGQISAELGSMVEKAKLSSRMANASMDEIDATAKQIAGVAELSQAAMAVVGVITKIAAQTKLLALNATIEAARAGDAGLGFAIVANEVKVLAKESEDAAEKVGNQIEQIRAAATSAASRVSETRTSFEKVRDVVESVSAGVVDQRGATDGIGRYAHDAAGSVESIGNTINEVADRIACAQRSVEQARGELAVAEQGVIPQNGG